MTLGETLRECRLKRSLTQRQLADKLGVTVNYISLLECDERTPSIGYLQAFARLMRLNLVITFEAVKP